MFACIAAVVMTLVVLAAMTLWNWLVPGIFGGKAITFWQTLGLLILSRFLFGRFGGPGRSHWRHRMRERWEGMTPEERERFRDTLGHHRCGHRHHRHDHHDRCDREPAAPAASTTPSSATPANATP